MKFRKWVFSTILVAGLIPVHAQDQEEIFGKKTPPRAPHASVDDALLGEVSSHAAVLADIVAELNGEDTELVVDFINKLYDLRTAFKGVLEKEVELRQSRVSDDAQKALVTQYIQLLHEEKEKAKAIINLVNRDLEAHESRLLQVMAKIHRVGDRLMKRTITNVHTEIKKFVRFELSNAQGSERGFFQDALRFLDQYFRG
ncbi:hypothetical protein HOF92_16510 [bacterium]|nr:hypothetical protein [bacterium]